MSAAMAAMRIVSQPWIATLPASLVTPPTIRCTSLARPLRSVAFRRRAAARGKAQDALSGGGGYHARRYPASYPAGGQWRLMPDLTGPHAGVTLRGRQHHDLGTDLDAVIEVDHVLVGHADAPGGCAAADGRGRIGAVDA